MNIKSLLLGSAAAFAVVSGAQAADAIVAAAPEPMEYVKVCDAFGAGYFYIPGTETCLKISGLVRYQLNYSSTGAIATTATTNPGYHWSSYGSTQARLFVDAKNDSELGTVYSWIRIQATDGQAAATGVSTSAFQGFYSFFHAGIDAGATGFEVGYDETAWVKFFGYGGFTDTGGSYDYAINPYFAFQGTSGNISYLASIDDLTGTAGKTAGLNAAVKGTFGSMGAALGVDYDIAAKAFGVKGYVSATFDPVSLKVMGIWAQSASYYAPATGFTLLIGGKANLTDKLFAAVDYSYSFSPKTWNVMGNIGWNVTSGFAVLAEGRYYSTKAAGGFLRLQRSF